jgi:hypothetical protein
MEFGFGIVILVIIVVVVRLLAGSVDENRVQTYIEERGGRFLSSTWAPFGKGWAGERNNRIYEVRYLDRDGNEHHAQCKTSMGAGVYFTEDRIVRYARRPAAESRGNSRMAELERENRQLREALKRAGGGKA